jgi:hypothetical protein
VVLTTPGVLSRLLVWTRELKRETAMNATKTKKERFVAKQDAKGWLVGDRWTLLVFSRHNHRVAAEYAARYMNRENFRAYGK